LPDAFGVPGLMELGGLRSTLRGEPGVVLIDLLLDPSSLIFTYIDRRREFSLLNQPIGVAAGVRMAFSSFQSREGK
jgi:hypothetical protein